MSKKSMTDVWAAMRKQHGDEGLFAGNDSMTTFTDTISSGSFLCMVLTGIFVPKIASI